MALIKNPLSGGGGGGSFNIVNGIIKQYKAESGVINANTFVEFVNSGTPGTGEDTQLSDTNLESNAKISAVKLSDNKVFIAHSGNGTSFWLYGVVVTITGASIVAGADTLLSNNIDSSIDISAVKVDSDKVFIAHSYGSSYLLYGMVCTISGTTITTGTDTQLSSNPASADMSISSVLVDTNKIFIAHSGNSNNQMYTLICTISGATITAGTDAMQSSQQYPGSSISAVLLDTNEVFVSYGYSSALNLYCTVYAISGTSVSYLASATLSNNSWTSARISAIKVDSNNVFVAHSYGSSNRYLYGIVVNISGSSISYGTDTQLSNDSYSGDVISAVQIDSSNVFIAHSHLNTHYLYGMVVTISDDTITAETDTALSNTARQASIISAISTATSGILVSHGWSVDSSIYRLYGLFTDLSSVFMVRSATDERNIRGLTAQSITDAAAGDVWVLNTSESE